MSIKFQWFAFFVLLLLLDGCATETARPSSQNNTPTTKPSATPLPTNTVMPTATPTPTSTLTPSPTLTPRPTRTPLPTSTPTPIATPTLTAAEIDAIYGEAIDSLEMALHGQELPVDYSHFEDFTELLRHAVTDFLNLTPQALTPLTLDTLLVELERLLPYEDWSSLGGHLQNPQGYLMDVDLDGQTDLILEPPKNYSGAIFAFFSSQNHASIVLSTSSGNNNDVWLEDVTGDKQPELWMTENSHGGSGYARHTSIFRWQSKEEGLQSLIHLRDHIHGADFNTWHVQPGPEGSQAFVTQETTYGIFDESHLNTVRSLIFRHKS